MIDLTTASDVNRFGVMKTYNAIISEGDIIAISAYNGGGPAGIIATINYYDGAGNQKILNTTSNWTCNASPALVQGDKTVGPWSVNWTQLDSGAQWIWDPKNAQSVAATCVVVVPSSS